MKITAKKVLKKIIISALVRRLAAIGMLSFLLVLFSAPVLAENLICGVHNECNAQQQCVVVTGVGSNQCQTAYDCVSTHTQCQNNQCVPVPGVGINQCQGNGDCLIQKHNECNAQQQCVVVDGPGANRCQTGIDCTVSYGTCVNQQCSPAVGVGISKCQANENCQQPSHTICSNQQCVLVSGWGSDQCLTSADCTMQSHTECSFLQCRGVPGVGINQCNSNLDCIVPKHNICKDQQCIPASGLGPDQCLTNPDCMNVPVDIPPPSPPFGGGIVEILTTPVAQISMNTIAAAGAVVVTAATATALFDFNFSLAQMLLLPFGFGTRRKPWGVVYDSVTKRPLDPAYVTLKAAGAQEPDSAITDLDGRYGFLVRAGTYTMAASKTHYMFPSQKLNGKASDELYESLYFGGPIEIKKDDDVIINNIPMDPIGFDWNEFAKKSKRLFSFYSKSDFVLRKVTNTIFLAGFLFAGLMLFSSQSPYNVVVFSMYVAFFVARMIGIKPRPMGYLFDKKTGLPLSFAVIRVLIPGLNTQVAHAVSDKYGRYYCLVGKGTYYVKIETKNLDESYSLAYTSPVMNVKNGIIKQRFSV